MAEALHVIYVNQSDHSFDGRTPGDLEWVFEDIGSMFVYVVHKRISEEVNEIVYKANSVHYESQRNIFSEWNLTNQLDLTLKSELGYKSNLSIF